MALPFYAVESEEDARLALVTIGRELYDGDYVWGADSKFKWKQDIEDIPEIAVITQQLVKFGEIIGAGRPWIKSPN